MLEEDQGEREASPDRWTSSPTDPIHQSDQQTHKALLRRIRWAREELNLRPLPCQIQQAFTGLYIGRLQTGEDRWKAAGERRCLSQNPPTIRHGSSALVLVPTAVLPICCPPHRG